MSQITIRTQSPEAIANVHLADLHGTDVRTGAPPRVGALVRRYRGGAYGWEEVTDDHERITAEGIAAGRVDPALVPAIERVVA